MNNGIRWKHYTCDVAYSHMSTAKQAKDMRSYSIDSDGLRRIEEDFDGYLLSDLINFLYSCSFTDLL